MYAVSRAGHDRGRLYIIIKEETEYVYLSDGELRPYERPKRKNKKHIQVIKKGIDTELASAVGRGGPVENDKIRKALARYAREHEAREKEKAGATGREV